MKETILNFHEFMLKTETITYIIMGISLLCILGFWCFLTDRDQDES